MTPPELAVAFVQYVHPLTLLGRVDGLRRVPFNVPIATTTTPPTFSWVGEGLGKPITRATFTAGDALTPRKCEGTIAVTAEVIKLAVRGSEELLRGELARGLVAFLDDRFINPAYAAVTDVSPAAITNGAASVASTGSSAANAVADFRALHALYVGAGGQVETAVIALSSANSVALNLTGAEQFQNLTRTGGTVGGIPVVASDSVGAQVVMFDAAGILVADDGAADFSVSTQAALELRTDPTQNATTGAGASLTSLWQGNLAAIRVERFVNWRVDGAVVTVTGALYYAAGSPA